MSAVSKEGNVAAPRITDDAADEIKGYVNSRHLLEPRWHDISDCIGALQFDRVDLIRALSEEQRRLIACVPTTWLDPLLTGETKVISEPPWNGPDIERLLRAIRERMEAK